MTSFLYRFCMVLPVMGLFFLGAVSVSHAAVLSYSDPNCASFSLQPNGNGTESFTLICEKEGPVNWPSGCSVTLTTPAYLPKSGGQVSLNGSCTDHAGGSPVYRWTRTGGGDPQAFPNTMSVSHILPANTGDTDIEYIYTMFACNGVDGASCSYPISRVVTVVATDAPPTPPTGCSISGPDSFTSSGSNGPFSLTASCAGTSPTTIYSWTRTGGGAWSPSGISVSDSLPANTSTSAIQYSYTMQACNGAGNCASAQKTITVAGTAPVVNPPTCSSSSATAAPASLGSSGGVVTLTASCSNTSSTTYTWVRDDGSSTRTGNSATDTLPANTGTTDKPYRWQMTACNNGTVCAAPVWTNTVTVTAPNTPPPSCNVTPANLPWGGQVTGNAGATGVFVAKVSVPAGAATGFGAINVSEYGSTATTRYVTVSKSMCDTRSGIDLTGTNAPMISQYVSNLYAFFAMTSSTTYPMLLPGGTYYINVWNKNSSGAGTCPAGACTMKITLSTP